MENSEEELHVDIEILVGKSNGTHRAFKTFLKLWASSLRDALLLLLLGFTVDADRFCTLSTFC